MSSANLSGDSSSVVLLEKTTCPLDCGHERKESFLVTFYLITRSLFCVGVFDSRSVLRGRTLGINILLLKLVFTGRQMLLESWGQNCFSLMCLYLVWGLLLL